MQLSMAASVTSVLAESWVELRFLSIILNMRGHQMYMYLFSICEDRAGDEVVLKMFWTIFKDKHAEARRTEI